MQATDADIDNHKDSSYEDNINFRPSPNFHLMKKYQKWKSQEAAYNGSSAGEQMSCSSAEEEERSNPPTAMVQPPLPPNPPPPDSPLHITLKKEIEDDEYQSNEEQKQQPEETEFGPGTSSESPKNDKSKIMCRQFVRGTCTRGASCIYLHELVLNQLPEVYTFCKNFQNSGCNLPKCKFVHATVFEKEYFYRSGYLPPHTLNHLKESNIVPPATLSTTEASAAGEIPTAFPNPPPPIVHSGMHGPGANKGAGGLEDASVAAEAGVARTTLKREWHDLNEFGASASAACSTGHDLCEQPTTKKCRHCDITELRYQCLKTKAEKLVRSTQESKKKLTEVTKKTDLVFCIIRLLLKNVGSPAIFNNVNTRNEKEKAILDQLNVLCSPNNIQPAVADDKAILDQLKMLYSANNRQSAVADDKAILDQLNMLYSANNRQSAVADDKNTNLSTLLVRVLLSRGQGGSPS